MEILKSIMMKDAVAEIKMSTSGASMEETVDQKSYSHSVEVMKRKEEYTRCEGGNFIFV